MADKIFFFHNPKPRGSSIKSILANRIPVEKRCPIIENDKVGHEKLGDHKRFCGFARGWDLDRMPRDNVTGDQVAPGIELGGSS